MLKGSCLCGGVRYEYHGEIQEISMCHCSQCRKAQGSAFVAVCPIDSDKFEFTKGSDLLKEFRAVSNKARVFCSNCGSPIYSARDDLPSVKRLRIGTIETSFECAKKYHIYSESRAAWDEITDQHPTYSELKV